MVSTQLVDSGILWWFHAPKGIWTGTQLVMPWSATDGIWIGTFDTNGEQLDAVRLEATTSPDDHHIASPGIRPDGRILVAYTPHSNSRGMRIRISATPGELDFGPEIIAATPQLGVISYPHLFRLSSERRWYLIYRDHNSAAINGSPWYVTSDDEGESWSAPIRIVADNGELPYTRVDSDGVSRIDVQITDGHPGTGFVADNSVYHFYYQDGQWSSSDGTDIGPLPVAHDDMTLVWDGTGQKAWNWDIVSGSDPVMVFSDVEDGQTNHRYIYARWTSITGWTTRFVTDSGGSLAGLSHYSPGINLDHDDPRTVVLARWIGDGIEVERWQTGDGGITWATETITDDSTTPIWNFRPFVPRGGGPFQIIFTRGQYGPSFTNFDTTIQAWPAAGQPPSGLGSELPSGVSSPIITWQSFDLVTGQLIADLPDLTGSISRLLGAHRSAGLSFPIVLSGDSATGRAALEEATIPGRTMIVAVVNENPAWGGRIIGRSGGTDGKLQLATSTLEAYLTRRRVRDHTFTNEDESVIMQTLFEDAGDRQVSGLGLVGGIGLEIEAANSGIIVDEEAYTSLDRTTVYDAVRERSARDTGLEWTIELLWADDDHTRIRKVIRIAPRIGIASLEPVAVFDTLSNNEAAYTYDEDYSDGRGATWTEAYSVGEGEDQPASDPAIATELLQRGWPIDEHHFQTDAAVQSTAILNQHAQRNLVLRKNGTRTWAVETRWNVFPQLNVDWRLGDDIGWNLIGHRHPPVFDSEGNITGGGITGQGRCIGWELDPERGVVTPILLDPTSEGES